MRKMLVVLFLIGASLSMAGGPKKLKVEDLSWMAGAWSCPMWGGTFEEYWTPVAGGTMQGCGRLIANGKTGFMEFMSIESSAAGITMYMMLNAPSKGDKKPVPFKLSSFDGKSAIFENAKNDSPSRVVYVKDGSGMSCYIEGMQNGKKSKETFAFKRMAMGG